MTTPLIQVRNLRKSYQMGPVTVHALDGVDLEVEANTFWTIMGPSGSGKSTLLYLLGGLDRPSAGTVEVAGQALTRLDENALAVYRRHTVGFIFQSFNLIPTLTALENVAFPMRFAHVSRRKRLERAAELLQRVGLGDRMQHKPSELSGGQQQRVAIARALVNEPRLILADEPTGNLDSSSGSSVMQLLAQLHQSDRTVVVVTHDARMTAYTTHMAHMLDGRLVDEQAFQAVIASQDRPFPHGDERGT